MKPHARRAAQAGPYFKLAVWDKVSLTFRDGKVAFPTSEAALAAAKKPGRYRVSQVNPDGRRTDRAPFDIPNVAKTQASSDGFTLGQTYRYQTYTQDGRKSRVIRVRVVEVRQMPTGGASAVGEAGGKRFWLYAAQRLDG